mgnify:CR=1 FL=1
MFCGDFRFGRRLVLFCLFLSFSVPLFAREAFFNFAEFKYSSSFTLPLESSEKEKAVSGSTGLKLSFRDLDLRGYVTLPKTAFSEIQGTQNLTEKYDLLNEPRYGAGVFLFKKSFPLTVKVGHNTYSKSMSKLKNPSPSTTANPLTKSFSFSTGLGSSLPTLTSSVQPLSLSLNFSVPESKALVPLCADFAINDEKTATASVSSKIPFSRFSYIQTAFSAGRFYLENTSTVLKKNYADFSGDWFYCALGEFSFHSPLVKLNAYAGFHQSPYDSDSFWLKFDGRTAFKMFLLDFSYFMIPTSKNSPKVAPLIGGSSSICRIVEQASVNPQLLFLLNDKNSSSIRLGFSALENWKVTATNTPVQLNTLKLRSAASYEASFLTFRFDWTAANILLAGEPPTQSSTPEKYHSFGVSSSLSGKSTKTSLSASYAYYPPLTDTSAKKETVSADVKFALPKKNLTAKSGVDMVFKNGERYSSSFDTSVNYCIKKKYLRTNFKIEFILPF